MTGGPAGAGNTLVAGAFRGTWRDLPPLDLPPAAAVFCAGHLDALRAAWAHATSPRETLVAAAARLEASLAADLAADGLAVAEVAGDDATVTPPTHPRPPVPGRLWLLTSGSTGRPKRVAHTLDSLTTVRGEQPPRTWLCPYTPGAYAWWQVVTLGLTQPGQHVVFVEHDRLDDWADVALAHGVDAASGTPTFWRQALLRAGDTLARIPLRQVTLGGEPVDQGVLDLVAAAFPGARVSWIYASSEAGAAIAVHDGRAGFPEAWLGAAPRPGRPALTVDGDELVIASPHRAEGVPAEFRTGDRVEVRDGRVHVVGRLASDEINVGGSKVSASAVRAVLLAHPGVAWAGVRGRRAPLVGTVVAADVVLADPALTEADLARWCAERLAEHAVPRRFRFLDAIPLKESLKSDV
jgi:acyl-coenzyme A synthetase/AMP-(fatty) acid ligase